MNYGHLLKIIYDNKMYKVFLVKHALNVIKNAGT